MSVRLCRKKLGCAGRGQPLCLVTDYLSIKGTKVSLLVAAELGISFNCFLAVAHTESSAALQYLGSSCEIFVRGI